MYIFAWLQCAYASNNLTATLYIQVAKNPIHMRWTLFVFGNFLRVLRGAGVSVTVGYFDKSAGSKLRQIFLDFRFETLLPEDVGDLFLRELEGKNPSIVLVIQLENDEGALDLDDVGN